MATTAENCARAYHISREAQDAYALRSQQLAHRAWTDGRLAEEVVPVEIAGKKGSVRVEQDDHIRPGDDAGRTGEAAARVLEGWLCDRRQRQRHRRWRCRGRARIR